MQIWKMSDTFLDYGFYGIKINSLTVHVQRPDCISSYPDIQEKNKKIHNCSIDLDSR